MKIKNVKLKLSDDSKELNKCDRYQPGLKQIKLQKESDLDKILDTFVLLENGLFLYVVDYDVIAEDNVPESELYKDIIAPGSTIILVSQYSIQKNVLTCYEPKCKQGDVIFYFN